MHTIEVSTGELLDKMSILQIKIDRLDGAKQAEAQKEYDAIAIPIMHHDYQYYYRLLRYFNERLWDIQQNLHEGRGDPVKDYPDIISLNDQRFKVKQKINRLSDSTLKEQKSYGDRKCVIYGHLGMGDMYWMNGAVRYFSTIYDEVVVLCKTKNIENVHMMYGDDLTIKAWPIPFDVEIGKITEHLSEHVMMACGIPAKRALTDYPDDFYRHLGIDPGFRTQFFHHAYQGMAEILLDQVADIPYILVHESKSSQKFDIVKHLNPDRQLIINIAYNVYPAGHQFYEIADRFVKLPLSCYIALLEDAKEIHLVESSLACLACHLDLSRVEVKKIYAASDHFLRVGVFEKGEL